MRIEIDDSDAYRHQIDTTDPELAGRWMAEKFRLLMSANARFGDCRLRIWPSTQQEHEALRGGAPEIRMTQDGLLKLAEAILDASKRIGEREDACSNTSTASRS